MRGELSKYWANVFSDTEVDPKEEELHSKWSGDIDKVEGALWRDLTENLGQIPAGGICPVCLGCRKAVAS